MHFGESTDVSNVAQLNVFARFWFSSEIYEKLNYLIKMFVKKLCKFNH